MKFANLKQVSEIKIGQIGRALEEMKSKFDGEVFNFTEILRQIQSQEKELKNMDEKLSRLAEDELSMLKYWCDHIEGKTKENLNGHDGRLQEIEA